MKKKISIIVVTLGVALLLGVAQNGEQLAELPPVYKMSNVVEL
nr:hypothetical protein [Fredinandcohnia onubensis]